MLEIVSQRGGARMNKLFIRTFVEFPTKICVVFKAKVFMESSGRKQKKYACLVRRILQKK
jgi:hypothetical protein